MLNNSEGNKSSPASYPIPGMSTNQRQPLPSDLRRMLPTEYSLSSYGLCVPSVLGGTAGMVLPGHVRNDSTRNSRIKVKLENEELWEKFYQIGTEMIITKLGRRMFPTLRFSISGLDPETKYYVILDLALADDCRFRYNSTWVRSGKAEPQWPSRMYVHPDSPATGAQWMRHEVSFQKAKLTNNTLDQQGHLVLTSMHKYVPQIHVIAANDYMAMPWTIPSNVATFSFPVASFIAVTAYANERITQLKIDNNPFAKGFRENGQLRVKKRQADQTNAESGKKSRPSSANSCVSSCVSDEESPVPKTSTPTSEMAAAKSPLSFSIARLVGENLTSQSGASPPAQYPILTNHFTLPQFHPYSVFSPRFPLVAPYPFPFMWNPEHRANPQP